MKKKIIIYSIITFTIILSSILIYSSTKDPTLKSNKINATILTKTDNYITVESQNNLIYTFQLKESELKTGDNIIIEYTGLLNENQELQEVSILNYKTIPSSLEISMPESWQDNGIFSNYYKLAYNKLKTLSLNEKIGQLILAIYPGDTSKAIDDIKKYKLSGYVFFEKDFKNLTKTEVINMTSSLQKASSIPLLTAVDEEGGKVVRISSNPHLRTTKFTSSSELYNTGGFPLIKEDTIEKSNLLKSLGLNLNLAPVVDVATNPNAYIYERTIKQGTNITSQYASTVISASKNTGVSYTLKHFPGYSNNEDTHTQTSTDNRTYDEILANDLPPFKSGINAGAEAILVAHNTITAIDPNNQASLSPTTHNLLRNELNFTGIIITDDLSMSALNNIDNKAVKTLLAGNNLLITSNYQTDINNILQAINNKTISENLIDKLAFKILAWKYYKGLLFENQK